MRHLAILFLLVGPLVHVANSDEPTLPVNLVNNPSLDGHLNGNGLPPDWYAGPPDFSTISAYTVPMGRTGERCLRIQSTGDWVSVITPLIEIQPKATQSAEVWYRLKEKSAGQIRMYINYLDSQRREISHSPVELVELSQNEGSTEWKRLHTDHIGSRVDGATSFCLVVAMVKPGVALFDDFALYQSVSDTVTTNVPNGDMELPTDQLNKAFPFGTSDEGAAQLTSDSENPHGGKASMRLSGKAKWVVMKLAEVDVIPGQAAEGSAWKRAKLGGVHFRLIGTGPNGNLFEKYLSFDTKSEWEETKWKLTPDELGKAIKLRFDIESHGEFDVSIDDVSIKVQ